MDKTHSWMWPQSKRSRTWVRGAAKTLAVMMGSHPVPSVTESISLFWTFNRYCCFKPFYCFDRAVHVIQLSGTALLWISWPVGSMHVKSLLNTSDLRYWEIIYSVQDGLRARTGVQGNALKYTTKFTRKKYHFNYKFRFYGNGL